MRDYKPFNTETVIEYIKTETNLFKENSLLDAEEIGDGNINLVFRIKERGERRSFIVKQALPYLRIVGDSWPLDINRGEREGKVLSYQYSLVDKYVPRLYKYDSIMKAIIMEDLWNYKNFNNELIGKNIYNFFSEQITDYLINAILKTSDFCVNSEEKKNKVKEFINPQMCNITERLVFTDPFFKSGTNYIEDELYDFVNENIWSDDKLKSEVELLKYIFMNNSECLIHGDLHTGSIFVNKNGIKVIDMEFAFYGPISFDIGTIMAHLIINYLVQSDNQLNEKHEFLEYSCNQIRDCIDLFIKKYWKFWNQRKETDLRYSLLFQSRYLSYLLMTASGMAGCEIIRRCFGLACSKSFKALSNDKDRIECKKKCIRIGKELILNQRTMESGGAYLKLIKNMKYFYKRKEGYNGK